VAVSLRAGVITMRDEIERDKRPSWVPFGQRRFPTDDLRLHRQLYPASRLRFWWRVSTAANGAILLSALVLFGSFGPK
jgi:hypothetical protein